MPVTRFTTKLLGTAGDDSVDQIDGAILAVNDITICACVDDDTLYFYKVDESGDAESSPDVIAPNLNAGNKRHKLLGVSGGGGGGGDTLPIADTTAVVKGSVDATKLVRIEADGLTTGTTRVLTMPDKDLTPAASGANTDITSILNAALYLGRDSDNKIDFATDDTLKIKIGGVEKAIVSISAGAGDNDKLVTQGYVDDNAGGGSSITETSVEDEAEITLDTAKTGWGTAMAGDNEEFIQFRFTAAGVVTIISNSANAINTNTDGFLCVYDAGTGIRIKNRLGATKTIRYIVNYS